MSYLHGINQRNVALEAMNSLATNEVQKAIERHAGNQDLKYLRYNVSVFNEPT